MTEPFVSSYDDVFRDAFAKGIEQVPDEHARAVKKICDTIFDEVIDCLFNYVADEMKANLDTVICEKAAKVAESMLSRALAGDDAAIKKLFGFNDWYMKHLYCGNMPTQWNLISAIAVRHPQVFIDERIKQLTLLLDHREGQIGNLHKTIERMREKDEGTYA